MTREILLAGTTLLTACLAQAFFDVAGLVTASGEIEAAFFAVRSTGTRSLAQRSRCAAAIRALPSELMVRRFAETGAIGLLGELFVWPGPLFPRCRAGASTPSRSAIELRTSSKRRISWSSAAMISVVFIRVHLTCVVPGWGSHEHEEAQKSMRFSSAAEQGPLVLI